MLIHMLVNTVSCGGNLIMNVGPTSRGYFDYRAEEALNVYGEWMRLNGRSIYGCTMAEPMLQAPEGCKLTQSEDGKRLYIHLQTYPFKKLAMQHLSAADIEYAQILSDGSEVLYADFDSSLSSHQMAGDDPEFTKKAVAFTLPVVKPHCIAPVIEVFLK